MNSLALKIAGAFVSGIWAADLTNWPLFMLYAAGIILLAAAVFALPHHPRYAWWLAAALFFICGIVRFSHANELPPHDISMFAGHKAAVRGVVSERPQIMPDDAGQIKVRYVLDIKGLADYTDTPVSGKMIVTVRQPNTQVIANLGQELTVTGTVLKPHGYNNPGTVDIAAALKRQGITARMSVESSNIILGNIHNPPFFLAKLASWRTTVEGMVQSVLPAEQAALVIGLIFGGYQNIPREIVQQFTLTGIVHILSVSGTHIALVAGVVLWVARRVRLAYRFACMLAAVGVVIYAVVAGLTPPVVRSALMGLAALLAIGVGREKDASSALAWSALAMVVYQPGLIYDISFQLSFGATAGLIFLYPATAERLSFLPNGLRVGLAGTWAAQVGTIPFLAWYFNTVSLTSFIANLLVLPLIEIVVVLGLAACLAAAVNPLLTKMLLLGCGAILGLAVKLTAGLAQIPGSSIYLPSFTLVGGLVYYTFIAWVYGYLPARIPTPTECWWRWPKYFLTLILIISIASVGYVNYPRPAAVHFIDVGQGDAALIITPHGRAVMVDTGGTRQGASFDIGERVVVPYLKHYGVLELDYLILTHSHQDHAGGAGALASAIPIKTIITARDQTTPALQALVYRKQTGIIVPAYEGQTIVLDGVKIEIVHAPAANDRGGNEASAVVRVIFGSHSFLLTGDLEARQEAALLATGQLDSCTVLKVGHHGARTATSDEFLTQLRPEFAVISVGRDNRYGHPHAEVLNRLQARGIDVYRTDLHGAVVFYSDGVKLKIDKFIR